MATAIASVRRPARTLTANPNPIINDGTGLGTTTIIVNANTQVNIYARWHSALRTPCQRHCPDREVGSSSTSLYGRRAGNSQVIATLKVPVQNPSGTISLSPNPIGVIDGSGLGVATVNFSANVPVNVYVRRHPLLWRNGERLLHDRQMGGNGTVFTLVNPAANNACSRRDGPSQAVAPSGTISLPNPIVVTDGTGLAIVNVAFTANVVADLYADGTLFCAPPRSTLSNRQMGANGTPLR